MSKWLLIIGLSFNLIFTACEKVKTSKRHEKIASSNPLKFQPGDDVVITLERRVLLNSQLEAQRKIWQVNKPDNYRYVLQQECFCTNGPNEIYIKNHKLEKVIYRGEAWFGFKAGDELSGPQHLNSTIEELFYEAERAINKGNPILSFGDKERAVERFSITYDEKYGFPVRMAYDLLGAVDDEYVVIIQDFRPL